MRVQAELSAALEEVEALRTARHRQTELVDAIVRQRDMFKALYTEAMVASGKDPQVCVFFQCDNIRVDGLWLFSPSIQGVVDGGDG
jgi:hypothetical protein